MQEVKQGSPQKDNHLIFVEEKPLEDLDPSPETNNSPRNPQAPADIDLAITKIQSSTGAAKGNLDMSSDSKHFHRFGNEIFAYYVSVPLLIKASIAMAVVGLIAVMYNTSVSSAFSDEAQGINVALARTTIGGIQASAEGNHKMLVVNQFLMLCVLAIGFTLAFQWKGVSTAITKAKTYTLHHHCTVVITKPT